MVRGFFAGRGYLEVDTPLLASCLIPESHIDYFETEYVDVDGRKSALYLVPSPEVHMKSLLAAGAGSMYQICRSFRNREPNRGIHSPEFTMLEWYTLDTDYAGSIDITEDLFSALGEMNLPGGTDREFWKRKFHRITMEEAFFTWAGLDLAEADTEEGFRVECRRLGIDWKEDDTWEQLFHRVFIGRVEPALPRDAPVVLTDYPYRIPTLAKRKRGTPWSQRWELFVKGTELANCYTEETDYEKVRAFFNREMETRKKSGMPVPFSMDYIEIFKKDFPPCSGVALGVDRLVMLLLGKQSLAEVMQFSIWKR
jgi:lysyl-tRNA synthetase class 2